MTVDKFLLRKLKEAAPDCTTQVENHIILESSLEERHIHQWEHDVQQWERAVAEGANVNSITNPYDVSQTSKFLSLLYDIMVLTPFKRSRRQRSA